MGLRAHYSKVLLMTRWIAFLVTVFSALISEAAFAESFKIGVIAPLSGPLASYGQATRRGIEFAVAMNSDAFKDLEFYYEDSQYDGKTSIAAFRKLVERDKVNFIYVWGVLSSEVIAPLVTKTKVPTLVYTLDENIHLKNPWLIRSQATPKQYGAKLQEHLAKNKLKKLAIFKVDLAYYTAMYDGLNSTLTNDQKVVLVESFPPSELDFKTSIAKLRQSGVDAVGVYLIPGQIAQLFSQLAQLRIKLPAFGTEDLGTRSEINRATSAMEGAVFAINAVDPAFTESYQKNFGDDTTIGNAAHAFDIAILLSRIRRDKAFESVMTGFRNIDLEKGVLGIPNRTISHDGGVSLTFPTSLGAIRNGVVVALE